MKILLDTNVVLDVLLNRKDFVNDSLAAMEKAISTGDRLYLSATAATDVFYVVKKITGNSAEALFDMKKLSVIVSFAEVDEECIFTAAYSRFKDFEDAVVDAVASHINADCIITRNVDDFVHATNKVMTPKDYLVI